MPLHREPPCEGIKIALKPNRQVCSRQKRIHTHTEARGIADGISSTWARPARCMLDFTTAGAGSGALTKGSLVPGVSHAQKLPLSSIQIFSSAGCSCTATKKRAKVMLAVTPMRTFLRMPRRMLRTRVPINGVESKAPCILQCRYTVAATRLSSAARASSPPAAPSVGRIESSASSSPATRRTCSSPVCLSLPVDVV